MFGSINHDTFDPQEDVAYSVAFRTLLGVSQVLKDDAIRTFAYEKCLAGLDPFKMCHDRNGVATRGLLYMEKSWIPPICGRTPRRRWPISRPPSIPANATWPKAASANWTVSIILFPAIAKHHDGSHGFLTDGVDRSNHVGQKHHVGGK